jgi:hypothetical protein
MNTVQVTQYAQAAKPAVTMQRTLTLLSPTVCQRLNPQLLDFLIHVRSPYKVV